jgi:hypothetical protein
VEALNKISHMWDLVEDKVSNEGKRMSALLASLFVATTGHMPIALRPHELAPNAKTLAYADPVLDLLEAIYRITRDDSRINVELIEKRVNDILNDHRIAYKMIDGRMFPFRGDPVYASTIEPTIRLLIDKRFHAAQSSYRKALQEIRANDPQDAITDAGTALQSTLEARGFKGNSIGALLADAKKSGFLAAHDNPLTAAIVKAYDWASADRSEKGDAHKPSDATLDDAWLMVQIVGALILRLASDSPRGTVPEDI